jgi:hypothetical protein
MADGFQVTIYSAHVGTVFASTGWSSSYSTAKLVMAKGKNP